MDGSTTISPVEEQQPADTENISTLDQISGGKDTQFSEETSNETEKRTDAQVAQAREEVDTNPTDGQKKAGNYRMGHVTIDGYDITIENPKGSVRSGKDASGKAWSVTMNNDYGYIRRTEGVDGDHIDVFLSDHLDDWDGTVYVIDQVDPKTGEFDEHKVTYGFNSMDEAQEAYLANYSKGWKGLGTITGVDSEEFRSWVDSSHRKTKAFSEYKTVNALEGQSENVGQQEQEGSLADSESYLNGEARYSVITDAMLASTLESGKTVKVYRAMQMVDGKLYPPMAGKINGKWQNPIILGRWEMADEHPELENSDGKHPGKFYLDKGNGNGIWAAYNPYLHTSRSMLNDQFSSAWSRPELVIVEVEVPESELTSGYKAAGAKDAVGETPWKSGPVGRILAKNGNPRMVILSRYDKPVRIVPTQEVAEKIAEMLAETGISIPFNTVNPELREALVAQGVTIGAPEKGNAGDASRESYDEWRDNVRFSVAATNKQFNDELQKQIDGTLPQGHIYKLGMPSRALLYAGIKDLPIEMSSSTLAVKSDKDYKSRHPYSLQEVRNLPLRLNYPIAVFDSESNDGRKVVLTELTDSKGNNFIGIIDVRKTKGRNIVSFNSVISMYPKESAGRVAKWFDSEFAKLTNKGEPTLLKWADIKKTFAWLANHASDVHAVGLSSRRIAKIVQKYSAVQGETENFSDNAHFSISAMDAAYMDAVNKGDMETAARMVRDAFKAAFPDTKVVDENGEPRVVKHGTPNSFTTFDEAMIGSHNDAGWLGTGFYFYGNNPEYAASYSARRGENGKMERGNVMDLFLNIRNPYYATREEFERLAEANDPAESIAFTEDRKQDGYDGVFYNGDLNEEWVAYDPNQIKSADPVTYDDEGNVIPLSQRFQPENPDIRYSIKEATRIVSDITTSNNKKYSSAEADTEALFSITRRNSETIDKLLSKNPNMTPQGISAFKTYVEHEEPVAQLAMAKWVGNGSIRLPEDKPTVDEALKICRKEKLDPMAYSAPGAIVKEWHDKNLPEETEKRQYLSPDNYPKVLTNKRVVGDGITIYDVADTKEGQQAVRDLMNDHLTVDGRHYNCWCLLYASDSTGELTSKAWGYWKNYNGVQKKVAFNKDGQIVSFCASSSRRDEWWDLSDRSHGGMIPVEGKVPNDRLGRSAMMEVDPKTGKAAPVGNLYLGNKKNGLYREWNGNDILVKSVKFKGGKLDGLCELWYDNGQMKRRTNYLNDRREGLYEEWYENGQMKVRANHKDGRDDGLYEDWYDNGQMRERTNYKNGQEDGLSELWHENGQIKRRVNYKNGREDGLSELWYDNGQMRVRANSKDGRYDGLYEEWYDNGQMKRRINYLNNRREGLYEEWYENGQMKVRANYKHGLEDGLLEAWYDSGQMEFRVTYKDGQYDGLYEEWRRNGQLFRRANL